MNYGGCKRKFDLKKFVARYPPALENAAQLSSSSEFTFALFSLFQYSNICCRQSLTSFLVMNIEIILHTMSTQIVDSHNCFRQQPNSQP